jgi:hypothetical protein
MARFFVQRVFKSRTWSRTESPNVRARQTGSRRAGCLSQYAKGALETVWGLALGEGRRVEWGGRSHQSLRVVVTVAPAPSCIPHHLRGSGCALRHMVEWDTQITAIKQNWHCLEALVAVKDKPLTPRPRLLDLSAPASGKMRRAWPLLLVSLWSAWSSKPRDNASKAHKRLNTTNPPSRVGKFGHACIVHLFRQLTIGYCSHDWCCV